MTQRSGQPAGAPVRLVRIIARLNVGGPAIQAITLTRRLHEYGYRTTLVRGREEPDEGSMDHLATQLGVRPVLVSQMRRNPGWSDLLALVAIFRIVRRERPHIVHTHAAKGGTLGRLATRLAFPGRRRRPVVIHTFHGHSLRGYFSPRTAEIYRRIERYLGRYCDRLIAVSDEVRDELVAMGVAPASKFEVVPLGFDLSPFMVDEKMRSRLRDTFRSEFGIPSAAHVVTLVARLVPIKRVDRFLRVATRLMELPGVYFVVVGDGELRESLRSSAEATALANRLLWTGFRRDMPAVYFASDIVIQTSDNEGTPVSLIEAQAAGVPVVSTRVGGTKSVVGDERFLASALDERALANAARSLLENETEAQTVGAAGRAWVLERFELSTLVTRLDRIYRSAMQAPAGAWSRGVTSSQ